MSKQDRLGGVLAEIEGPLSQGLKETIPSLDWLDTDLTLTYSVCGLATAALQRCLKQQGITTARLAKETSILVAGRDRHDEKHVLLQTDDGQVIDPTYTQYFGYIGLSSHLAQQYADMRELLPASKVAVFETARHKDFAQGFAERALAIRPTVTQALAARTLDFVYTSPELLEGASASTVEGFYGCIWRMPLYKNYSIDDQMTTFPELGDYVDDVVSRMADVH